MRKIVFFTFVLTFSAMFAVIAIRHYRLQERRAQADKETAEIDKMVNERVATANRVSRTLGLTNKATVKNER